MSIFSIFRKNKKIYKFTDKIFPKIGKSKKKGRFWRKFLLASCYLILTFILVVAGSFAWFSKDLPTPSKIANRKPATSTKIYDRTGEILLYETGEQKRTIVESEQISSYLKDATVAVEDAKFYEHRGVDIRAILSAVKDKLLGRTARTRGGSTITQQYVKNALLTSDRSMVRKIKEAILSVELEFMFKKDQILTMYLNEIPYGSATAGAEAASVLYYGKPAKDLSLAEAATLAAIPKAPSTYSPYGTHVDRLIARRNYILDRMVETGKVSQEDAEKAKLEDTTTVGKSVKARKDSILAPHFVMYIQELVASQYGEDMINKEGLKVITTLDYEKQKSAEEAVTQGVPKNSKYNASNAALIALDPKNGQVLAMVGSKDYWDVEIDGNVNVAISSRQPGSSFKPIAYATAFKNKEYSPSKIIYDFETDFGGGYTPHNYTSRSYGPVTIRQALSNSLNIPAVKIMSLAGLDNVIHTAEDMGITTLTQRDRYGLSLVLGTGEVPPIQMAGAFSVFANGGVNYTTSPILKIIDSSNETLFEWNDQASKPKQALDPQIAYQIASILSDNEARNLVFGTRSSLYFPNRTVAAKTGTTSDFKDAWTVGFTPSIATAVWVGNSDGTKMKSGADGSVLAGPIFHNFIEKALANVPDEPFAKPDGIQELTVERYSNKRPNEFSKEFTKDIFASWQTPTEEEKDDINKIVKVCKGTNLVAPDDLPTELIENKVFTSIRSERPDFPNWEGPVHAWAVANGFAQTPPVDKCDASTMMLKINITSPANNSEVSGETTITAEVQNSQSISNVEFFLNGVSIGSTSSAPYSLKYNFRSFDTGEYKLSAIATETSGLTAKSEITIKIVDAPFQISGIQVKHQKNALGEIFAEVSWLTDAVTHGEIAFRPEGGTQEVLSGANVGLSHTIKLPNLILGKKYFYTITAKDMRDEIVTKDGNFTVPISLNNDLPIEPAFE